MHCVFQHFGVVDVVDDRGAVLSVEAVRDPCARFGALVANVVVLPVAGNGNVRWYRVGDGYALYYEVYHRWE